MGYSSFLKNVKALFFTHLHMDHTTDYPTLLLCGQGAGLTAYPDSEADKRLQVYGPGTRGQLEDVYPAGRTNVAPIMNPTNPTPGTVDVTRTLWQACPNFAFRFDTADGSVVFAGDVGYPCTNLVQLAQGADLLVHEVIDPAFIDNLFPPPLTPATQAMKYHLETAHTSITNVGKHATAANVPVYPNCSE